MVFSEGRGPEHRGPGGIFKKLFHADQGDAGMEEQGQGDEYVQIEKATPAQAEKEPGMEEQRQNMEHDGQWAKQGGPLEVPDESLRPEQAPESLETAEDLDNLLDFPKPPRMEDPTDAPKAAAAK